MKIPYARYVRQLAVVFSLSAGSLVALPTTVVPVQAAEEFSSSLVLLNPLFMLMTLRPLLKQERCPTD